MNNIAAFKNNIQVYFLEDNNQIRGKFNHSMVLSNGSEFDFLIARKTSNGFWVAEENILSGSIDNFFDQGFSGDAMDLVKIISQNIIEKRKEILIKERKKEESKILIALNELNNLFLNLTKHSVETLINSYKSRKNKGGLADLYQNKLNYLNNSVDFLLTEKEFLNLQKLNSFFNSLEDYSNSESFEILSRFCKKN